MAEPQRRAAVVRRSSCADSGPQAKRQRYTSDASIVVPTQRPGKILQVTLKNFMCHEHLEIKLNESVNFITGENGSGKSAVLTAIMVGLGSRAKGTDRGSSLPALIRNGQSSAEVTVKLCNTGELAYKKDLYGDAIFVKRTIRKDGSSFSIKSAAGKKIASKGKDLEGILDALNIQTDNPITVLTQDTSKTFLFVNDPRKKYQLFLRATRLKHIMDDYESIDRNLRSAEDSLDTKEKVFAREKERAEELKDQANRGKDRKKIEDRVQLLGSHLSWAQVKEKEQALHKEKESVEKITSRVKELEESVKRYEDNKMTADNRRTQLEQQLKEVERELRQIKQHKDERQTHVKGLYQRQRDAAAAAQAAQSKTASLREELGQLMAEVDRQRHGAQPDDVAEERQRQETEQRCQQQLQQLQASEKMQREHLKRLEDSLRQKKSELAELEADMKTKCRNMAELKRRRDDCAANQHDQRGVFGAWVAGVDADVDRLYREGRFQKKPIGPVGAYVRIQDGCERWTRLVETCLQNILTAYLVDNHNDQRGMRSILQKHTGHERVKPRIIVSKFLTQVHDVSRHGIDTSGRWVSVWSVVDIRNPVVANAIIDQTRAESVLLLETDADACDIMAYRQRVPSGCEQALTNTGYRYYPDPRYRTYPAKVPKQPRYLHVTVEQVISDLDSRMLHHRDAVDAVTKRVEAAHAASISDRRQLQEAKSQLGKTDTELETCRLQLRELQGRERPQPVDLQLLEDEVASLKAGIYKAMRAEAPHLAEQERIGVQVEEAKSLLEDDKAALGGVGERTRKLQEELGAAKEDVQQLKRKLDGAGLELEGGRAELARLTKAAAVCQRQLVAAEALAGPHRVEPTKSVAAIQSELDGLQRSLRDKDGEPQRSSRVEDLLEAYSIADECCKKTKMRVQLLRKDVEKFREMLDMREKMRRALEKSLGVRIAIFFGSSVGASNYEGEMKFDHDSRQLTITVEPAAKGDGKGRDPSQLSGGERSFSTLACLLAMWSTIPSPFRILDEFDVFMDEMNRKISHDMLLKEALANSSQFVFISPLNIPWDRADPRVTVHRMHPPKRERHEPE